MVTSFDAQEQIQKYTYLEGFVVTNEKREDRCWSMCKLLWKMVVWWETIVWWEIVVWMGDDTLVEDDTTMDARTQTHTRAHKLQHPHFNTTSAT